MRVLATFVGGWGHAEPLLPIARLAASLGHAVAFAGQPAVIPRLGTLGFETFAVGPDTLSSERRPLLPLDREAEQAVMRNVFVRRLGGVRATQLRLLFEREQPALVVCDEVDFGAVVAAEALGIRCVTVNVIAAGRLTSPAVIGAAWNKLRTDHGLLPDAGAPTGDLRLAPLPRSFRGPESPLASSLRWVRPEIVDRVGRLAPAREGHVYATIGTVFGPESGDLLHRLAGGLSLVGRPSLLTVGPGLDPGEIRPADGQVRIEQFVPQDEILDGCTAVACHGGSGTLIAALSLGIPVVVLPMGADQADNADRCAELGVGVVLDAVSADASSIAAAVRAVTGDRSFARAAGRLADEAAEQPRLADVPEVRALFERP